MNRFLPALLMVLLAGRTVAADPPTVSDAPMKLAPIMMYGTVAANGSIRDLSCGSRVAEDLCKVVSGAVSAWQFKPGTRAGQPSDIEVRLALGLVAIPAKQGYSLQITSASLTGMPKPPAGLDNGGIEGRAAPIYAFEDAKHSRVGMVDVEILLQPPTDVPQVGQVWFNGAPSDARNSMVASALTAVRKWKLPPMHPEQLSACTAIEFSIDNRSGSVPGRKSPCAERFAEGFNLPFLLTKVGTAQ